MKVLRVHADLTKPPMVIEIERGLDATKAAIGGGWLEGIGGQGWMGYVDEEGKLKGLEPNWRATALAWALGWPTGDHLVGTVIFFGPASGGVETDVPDFVVQALMGEE